MIPKRAVLPSCRTGSSKDLGEGERFDEGREKEYLSQAYGRLHRKSLAYTITCHFLNPGSGRFIHYKDHRAITVREAARFQSFEDSFVFVLPGYNLRPNEINGSIGIEQLKKIRKKYLLQI